MIVPIVFVILMICILVFIVIKFMGNKQKTQEQENTVTNPPIVQRVNVNRRREAEEDDDDNEESNERETTGQTQTTIIPANPQVEIDPNKTYTKKEKMKMEKKRAKAEEREMREEYLKQKKEKQMQEELAYQMKEQKRKEEEAKEEEMIRKIKEEKEAKEIEEYKQWEKTFAVAEEGEGKVTFSDKVAEEFVTYIKLRKVISIEDLSGTFKLSSAETVNKLQELESLGKICGIIDDRGKYVYLTDKELQQIEKLINTRGRISKQELINQCNKLIKFEPSEEDKANIQQQYSSIIKDVTVE